MPSSLTFRLKATVKAETYIAQNANRAQSSWRICCSRGCSRVYVRGSSLWHLRASRLLQQIAVADIGAFVATVIERIDAVFGRRFDIAGDELTGEEAAAFLSKVTGREVHYEGFPPDVLRAQSEDMALMLEWFG